MNVRVEKCDEKYVWFLRDGKLVGVSMRAELFGVKVGDMIDVTYDFSNKLGRIVSVRMIGLFILFLLVSLACKTTALPPTQTTAKVADLPAVPAVYEVVPTPMTVGNVVAAEALHVRAGHDLSSESVGYLYSNDLVLEMDCFTEDGITWAKHQTGWSVVRNGTAEYIAGVCEKDEG